MARTLLMPSPENATIQELKVVSRIEFSSIVEHPELADRTFWTAKAFHGYISNTYQVECGYETTVRFFHRE